MKSKLFCLVTEKKDYSGINDEIYIQFRDRLCLAMKTPEKGKTNHDEPRLSHSKTALEADETTPPPLVRCQMASGDPSPPQIRHVKSRQNGLCKTQSRVHVDNKDGRRREFPNLRRGREYAKA